MAVRDPRVHFIYLGGEFLWQHWRAIETAKVHDAPITVWCAQSPTGDEWDRIGEDVQVRELVSGSHTPAPYLRHPMGLANVKDLFAWSILYEHGGLYLDLDTISLRPCWDLLTRDVCVSFEHEPDSEYDPEDDRGHPYNSAVVLGRQGADVLSELAERAEDILDRGESRWGSCGPHLLSEVVSEYPNAFDIAPFGALNGWRDGTAIRYYNGERPGPETRVAHLFSSSRFHLFEADRWMPEMVTC